MDSWQLIRLMMLSAVTFAVAIAWTPLLSHVLYRFKLGKTIRSASSAPIASKLHRKKSGTPTMGGVLVWLTVLFVAAALLIVWTFAPHSPLGELSFPHTFADAFAAWRACCIGADWAC